MAGGERKAGGGGKKKKVRQQSVVMVMVMVVLIAALMTVLVVTFVYAHIYMPTSEYQSHPTAATEREYDGKSKPDAAVPLCMYVCMHASPLL